MVNERSKSHFINYYSCIVYCSVCIYVQGRKFTYSCMFFVTTLAKVPVPAKLPNSAVSNVINTADQASVEFSFLLDEILKELMENRNESLKLLKRMSSTLTVKDTSGVRMFSDSEVEGIYACSDIEILLVVKLRHCYRWDDHSMLNVLMDKINSKKCLKLLQLFESKIFSKFKLQQMSTQVSQDSTPFPDNYHKMVAIVDKIFSSITKEEYDELKQFKNNVHKFTKMIFLYLKISSEVIFDHRENVRIL